MLHSINTFLERKKKRCFPYRKILSLLRLNLIRFTTKTRIATLVTENFLPLVSQECVKGLGLWESTDKALVQIEEREPSLGECTLKWCDGLGASMTSRALSMESRTPGRPNQAEQVCGGRGQTRVCTHADPRSRKMLAFWVQTLKIERCLPSGRGVNRASTHFDKHSCVAF